MSNELQYSTVRIRIENYTERESRLLIWKVVIFKCFAPETFDNWARWFDKTWYSPHSQSYCSMSISSGAFSEKIHISSSFETNKCNFRLWTVRWGFYFNRIIEAFVKLNLFSLKCQEQINCQSNKTTIGHIQWIRLISEFENYKITY